MKLFREDFSPKLARNYNDCSAVIIVCLHYSRIFVFACFAISLFLNSVKCIVLDSCLGNQLK